MQEQTVKQRAPQTGARGGRERLLAGLPVVERRLDLAGISTAVLEGGQGIPLVLLHGPGEHAAKWLRVIPDLVGDHRVIAPDLPGHGSSVVGDGALDGENVLRWLEALVDATCESPPVLLGQVVGGAIAARFAAAARRPLRRLLLADSLGLVPFHPAPEFGEALQAFLAGPDERTVALLWRRCAFDLDRLMSAMGPRWDDYIGYTLERVRSPQVSVALHQLMAEFGLPAIPAEELTRIGAPVALIWGRHDLATPLTVAAEASRRYGWPLHVVEGSGDDPAMEQPERFLAALRAAERDPAG
jgi:pimeloyl-ACP methyl ester carboxylesterase